MSIPLTATGEIISLAQADQFQPAKSQFMCGFFGVAMARSMAQPGQPPTLTVAQIIADAEQWYTQYNGSDDLSNEDGMSDEQLYELLGQVGLHYQATSPDSATVARWIAVGYPVIVALVEASVRDLGLGNICPYPWTPNGNHIILVTGLTSSGNFLVRDSANCTSLSNPNSLRPGPRVYDPSSLQILSATVAVPPWRPRPATSNPPPGGSNLNIPANWTDDGTTLTAPNGQAVTGAFRQYILAHPWDGVDVPMGPPQSANPVEVGYQQPDTDQSGLRLVTMYSELCQTTTRGVYRASVGREFWTLLNKA